MSRLRADLGLVLITLVWGTTFALVHEGVAHLPVLSFLALRFAIASIILLPFAVTNKAQTRRASSAGGLLGALLFAGFLAQTMGLRFTTPSRAAFITGLCVVLVPILGPFFGQRPTRRALVGVAFGFTGLLILVLGCRLRFFGCSTVDFNAPQRALGDLLVVLCTFAFALHIIGVAHHSRRHPALPLGIVQLATVSALSMVGALVLERSCVLPSGRTWAILAFLGLMATALNFTLQIAFQRHTSSTHAALIYSLEPVFATLFSWLWIGETLTTAVMAGGGLMLIGVIIAEMGVNQPPETRLRNMRASRVS